jgi:hypothetical protein
MVGEVAPTLMLKEMTLDKTFKIKVLDEDQPICGLAMCK